jgi:hypothetical protein
LAPPQEQLIDVEGGETEAEIEDITSKNAEMLQRELQNMPQLTLRGYFQSPPTQALGSTAEVGEGATAGGATAGNGNGNGATAGNGNGNGAQAGQNGKKQKVPVTTLY